MSLPDGPFIFVSYSSKDSDFVHPEIRRLERQGYKVWYDKGELRPGRLWAEEIREAIAACACFVVFITQYAVDSENVCDEMEQALEAGKPFICIYWEKVELPSRFQKPIRSMQTLERYSLRRYEYEEPLGKALSEYTNKTESTAKEKDKGAQRENIPPPPPDTRTDPLPKIVFFALLLSAGAALFLAFVTFLTPYFASPIPGDPLNNRLAGFMAALFFTTVAVILSGVAFVVHGIYLRRKNG